MSLNKLPATSVKRLHSSIVISSVFSAVKELVENALDSRATAIDVKLVNYGLDSIEIQDNGVGISSSNVKFMCLPHYTSKISDFSDLGTKLNTYGFRGEALSSLCNVSSVSITTRTENDEYASVYSFDHHGEVIKVEPSHFGKGTTVVALNIFNNLPVRRRYMSTSSKLKTELKKIEIMIKNFAMINYNVSFTFCHDKHVKWQKSRCSSLKESVFMVMGSTFRSQMDEVSTDQTKNNITLIIPKKGCSTIASICLPEADAVRIFINQRPVEYKKLKKVIMNCFQENLKSCYLQSKFPLCIVSVKVPPSFVDVNTEPNKTKVICHNEDELIAAMEKVIVSFYQPSGNQDNEVCSLDDGQVAEGQKQNEVNSNHLKRKNFICTDDKMDTNNIPEDRMDLWSRGNIISSDGKIVQGGATLLKSRVEEGRLINTNNVSNLKRNNKKVQLESKSPSNFAKMDSFIIKQSTKVPIIDDELNNKELKHSSRTLEPAAKRASFVNSKQSIISDKFEKSIPNSEIQNEDEINFLSWYKPPEKLFHEKPIKIWSICKKDWHPDFMVN